VLADRRSYAGILLDVAATVRRAPAGLPMARPGTVRRRVERILAATDLPVRAGWRQRLLVTAAVTPLVAMSAAAIVHGTPSAERPAVAALPAEPEPAAALAATSQQDHEALHVDPAASGRAADPAGERVAEEAQPRSATDVARASPHVASHQSTSGAAFMASRPGLPVVDLDGERSLRLLIASHLAGALEETFTKDIADRIALARDAGGTAPSPRPSSDDLRETRTAEGSRDDRSAVGRQPEDGVFRQRYVGATPADRLVLTAPAAVASAPHASAEQKDIRQTPATSGGRERSACPSLAPVYTWLMQPSETQCIQRCEGLAASLACKAYCAPWFQTRNCVNEAEKIKQTSRARNAASGDRPAATTGPHNSSVPAAQQKDGRARRVSPGYGELGWYAAPKCPGANVNSCIDQLTRVGFEPRVAGPRCSSACLVVSQNIR
jgi:hypothetical protein